MKRTISMTAWRRPDYTRQVLESLLVAIRPGWEVSIWVDGGHFNSPVVADTAIHLAEKLPEYSHASVTVRNRNAGVDQNTFDAVESEFLAGSDFNLHIEDDTVLSPDAIDLCEWFIGHPLAYHYYALLLHAHSTGLDGPLDLGEQYAFCPWGWGMHRHIWNGFIKPNWNEKRFHPKGWDWSIGMSVQEFGLKALSPLLSRTRNIGREGGTYETPDHHDEWAKHLTASDGSYGTNYRITQRLPEGFRSQHPDWYLAELEARRAHEA